MFCPGRILVPVDFSSSAMPAVHCAHDVAQTFGSRVHLLHVCAEPAPQGRPGLVCGADLERRTEACRADAMTELTAFAALATRSRAQRPGTQGPTLAVRVSADAPAAILAYAREAGCDLIVMGTHRPSPIALLPDSTADWVRRHATCPVVLVPPMAEFPARQPTTRDAPDAATVG